MERKQIILSPFFLEYLGRLSPNSNKGIMIRNIKKIKYLAMKSFIVGKTGFKMGLYVGSFLGFGIGVFQAAQMKKLWVIPVSMVGSGLVFGSMFAFSSVLKAESEDKYKYFSNVNYSI